MIEVIENQRRDGDHPSGKSGVVLRSPRAVRRPCPPSLPPVRTTPRSFLREYRVAVIVWIIVTLLLTLLLLFSPGLAQAQEGGGAIPPASFPSVPVVSTSSGSSVEMILFAISGPLTALGTLIHSAITSNKKAREAEIGALKAEVQRMVEKDEKRVEALEEERRLRDGELQAVRDRATRAETEVAILKAKHGG